MKTSSAKAKGRRLVKQVIDALVFTQKAKESALSLADFFPSTTSQTGEDVVMSPKAREVFPISIECKNQEALNFWAAFKQAQKNAGPYMPVLIASRNREPEPLAVLRMSDLLVLLSYEKDDSSNLR
jgi:hypothetical protein